MQTKTFDPTKPVQTMCGLKARIISTKCTGRFPIGAKVMMEYGSEVYKTFTSDGWEYTAECGLRLVNVPEEQPTTPPAVDWTKPIQTTCGKKARVLCTDYVSGPERQYPIVAVVTVNEWSEALKTFTPEGLECRNSNGLKIINVPPKPVITYANVYPNGTYGGYVSREKANANASKDRIACIRLVDGRGQYDD